MIGSRRRALRWTLRGALAAALALAVLGVGGLAWLGSVWLSLPSIDGLGGAGDPGPAPGLAVGATCREAPRSSGARSSSTGAPSAASSLPRGGAAPASRRYRALDEIDPRLACAVIWAEDGRFFRHDGVDWVALRAAARDNWGQRRLRVGAGTVAMQVARYYLLPGERGLSRKIAEVLLAPRLVERYGRRRLLELYLNAVSWAPCVRGAETAARHYLGHSANAVSVGEAAFLASMLPHASRRGWPAPDWGGQAARDRLLARETGLVLGFAAAGWLEPGAVPDQLASLHRLGDPRRSSASTARGALGPPGHVHAPASEALYRDHCGLP